MKSHQLLMVFCMVLLTAACSKTAFITSPDASVSFSRDTLRYDTVFTSTGSVTQSFKIFNQNDQKLKLSAIQLKGGAASAFKMNVDGAPGTSFTDIELRPNDSLYVFVTVSVNPTAANLPFIVQDSIQISFNGNNRFVQLEAYGQNARFLRGKRITTDSTWDNSLPYVILDSVQVDEGVTLTIQKGCKVYHHANAPFIVNGTLKVNGDSNARVSFQGDRLDPDYKNLPASWPGFVFSENSKENVLNYTTIGNAYQGIVTTGQPATGYKITLHQCIIDNAYDAGILSAFSSIQATNCLISNCGANVYLYAGGKYLFDYCTVVTYGNLLISHQTPVCTISDADATGSNTYPLNAIFRNSIFYGENGNVDDEVFVNKKGGQFTLSLSNVLYKNKSTVADTYVTPNLDLKNQSPEFENIDASKLVFDFHLKDISPALNAGTNVASVPIDLEGKPRPLTTTDIGCYQKQ